MTDEERQKLCSSLRDPGDNPFTFQVEMLMEQAADEIERLAEENKRLKEEPKKLMTEMKKLITAMTDEEYIAFRRRIADEQGTHGSATK